MTTYQNDLDQKSDEELLAISNGKIPHGMLSARSTTTGEDIIIQAKIILHKRQKKSEKSLGRMTLWILILTVALVVFTAILVYFAIVDKPTLNMSNTRNEIKCPLSDALPTCLDRTLCFIPPLLPGSLKPAS